MTEAVNGMSFQQAKSLLDIDKAVNKKAEKNTEKIALFDANQDGQLDLAEQEALFAYRENQDKVPFDFDKNSKLDKAELKAYKAYTIQRGEEKHAELVNNVAKAIARNEDGSLDTDAVKRFSNEKLDEIADTTAFANDVIPLNEKVKIVKSALVLAEYNRENGMNNTEIKNAGKPIAAPTADYVFLADPGNFKLPEDNSADYATAKDFFVDWVKQVAKKQRDSECKPAPEPQAPDPHEAFLANSADFELPL